MQHPCCLVQWRSINQHVPCVTLQCASQALPQLHGIAVTPATHQGSDLLHEAYILIANVTCTIRTVYLYALIAVINRSGPCAGRADADVCRGRGGRSKTHQPTGQRLAPVTGGLLHLLGSTAREHHRRQPGGPCGLAVLLLPLQKGLWLPGHCNRDYYG